MLIEATLLGIGVLIWKKLGQGHEWTPEHEEMYQAALENLKGEAGVIKLREIADECAKNGHHVKAFALRKRADLRATPAKLKKERHEVYKRAMRSTNVEAMLNVALEFERITATKAAQDIRERVAILQAQQDQVVPDAPEATTAAEPAQEVRVATEAPAQEPTASEVPPPQAEAAVEAPAGPRLPSPRARIERMEREASGLQETQSTARTTPAPPPIIDVEGVSEPVPGLLNGASHEEQNAAGEASAQSS
jgi:hypothetical protein